MIKNFNFNKQYFFHSPGNSITKLEPLVLCKKILSQYGLGYDTPKGRFNYLYYISLCGSVDISQNADTAFEEYIRYNPSIVIDRRIDAIKTIMLAKEDYDKIEDNVLRDSITRYSVFSDEWQVKDEVDASNWVAINYPYHCLISNLNEQVKNGKVNHNQTRQEEYNILYNYYVIKALLAHVNLNLQIIDVECQEVLDELPFNYIKQVQNNTIKDKTKERYNY